MTTTRGIPMSLQAALGVMVTSVLSKTECTAYVFDRKNQNTVVSAKLPRQIPSTNFVEPFTAEELNDMNMTAKLALIKFMVKHRAAERAEIERLIDLHSL